ncbi:hypothetical protein GCM10011316_17720 [Roseibium aquae]|uniref:Lipoprotein n=1 Tax=Roseibium aquae TaxID=1323746 RepID=A0A916X164_9HYPH|nr:hypothetical protein [Roseibium aquae]GGB46028.1 hypothetical protein GCM10011316_17720 [Roseibium aquae]
MRILCILALAASVTACAGGSSSPRLDSRFIGKPSADFFLKYGPPDQVIGFEAVPPGTDPLTVTQSDPKELVYYWSSVNRKTLTADKSAAPRQDCSLAILTRANGRILRIEVQADDANLAAARTYCESIVD